MGTQTTDIITQINTILTNDIILQGYIIRIFEGERVNVPKNDHPYIAIEPAYNEEREIFPKVGDWHFRVNLICVMYSYDLELQIVGNATTKGILDIEKDVKNALMQYPDLNGSCAQFEIPRVTYGYAFSVSPGGIARGFVMELSIHSRRNY